LAKNGDTEDLIHIDFVGIRGPIRYSQRKCGTTELHDDREKRADHLAVALEVEITPEASTASRRRKVAVYDRSKVVEGPAAERFRTWVAQLPKVPHNVEPTSHQFLLADWLQKLAAAAFPRDQQIPRNPIHSQ
jgi:hypothetical protein